MSNIKVELIKGIVVEVDEELIKSAVLGLLETKDEPEAKEMPVKGTRRKLTEAHKEAIREGQRKRRKEENKKRPRGRPKGSKTKRKGNHSNSIFSDKETKALIRMSKSGIKPRVVANVLGFEVKQIYDKQRRLKQQGRL